MSRIERKHLLLLYLKNGQTSGPARLGRMWESACGANAGTSVACPAGCDDSDEEVTYHLTANLEARLQAAEASMRQILDDSGFSFRLTRSR